MMGVRQLSGAFLTFPEPTNPLPLPKALMWELLLGSS